MLEVIAATIDQENHVVFPAKFKERLGLSPGMMLVVEEDMSGALYLRVQSPMVMAEDPPVVDDGGVLVVMSQIPPLSLVTHLTLERERRVADLIQLVGR